VTDPGRVGILAGYMARSPGVLAVTARYDDGVAMLNAAVPKLHVPLHSLWMRYFDFLTYKPRPRLSSRTLKDQIESLSVLRNESCTLGAAVQEDAFEHLFPPTAEP
jgi:hypothetical protein